MAEAVYIENTKGFAFNSVGDDRSYDANDLCDWLKSTNSNGVRANPVDQLKVIPPTTSDLIVQVTAGVGLINGHSMELSNTLSILLDDAPPASVGQSRIDIVGFRINYSDRRMEIFYRPGTPAANPTIPELIQNKTYYELCLAEITVTAGLSTIGESNIHDTRDSDKCGFVISTTTIFTQDEKSFVTETTTTMFTIDLEVFNPKLDIVNITVNGNKLAKEQFFIQGRNVILKSPVYANNTITYTIWHFIDAGKVLANNMSQVEEVSEEVNKMVKYYYFCNGVNDNMVLSQLAQDFLAGTGDYVGVDTYAQMEIVVCGSIGISSEYSGDGETYPYTYFAFGRASSQTRTIYFNFSNCDIIKISNIPTNKNAIIFSGADINIRNVALDVSGPNQEAVGYKVDIFNGQNIHCEDSEFWMTTVGDCCVGRCCGLFENVRTSILSTTGNAFCFYGNGRLTRVIGGMHHAWSNSSNQKSTSNPSGVESVCFYVEKNQTENVIHVTMANMPEHSRSGYTQSRPVKINNGYATFFQNTMWMPATVDNGSFYSATNCTAYGNVIISKN